MHYLVSYISSCNKSPDVALESCTIQFRIFRVIINRQMSRWSYALFGFIYFVLYYICVEYFSNRNKSLDVALELCTIRFHIFRIVLDLRRVFFDR